MSEEILKRLKEFVTEVNLDNSSLYKIEVLKKYPDLKTSFVYIYDTIKYIYGITSENLKKLNYLEDLQNENKSLFEILDSLNERKYTGHSAIKLVNMLVKNNKEYEDLIYDIIDRNLKTRTDSKLINKVYPGLISQFNVALAEVYDSNSYLDLTKNFYYCSRKCDGVRVITIINENGSLKFFSRQGKEFQTLDILRNEILSLGLKNIVLDGELCLLDENGNEDFQNIMKQIRKKDHIIQNPMYLLFDILTIEEFSNEYSEVIFDLRLKNLKELIPINCKNIKILEQNLLRNDEDLDEQLSLSKDWEGLILRKCNSCYEGKRSKNMLKLKSFIDNEYIVKDIKLGEIRHFIDGKEITSVMLSKIIIEHKGNLVGVGSGFTMEDRLYYKDFPEEIIGKVVTVKYFEETQNQDGNYSLRFPTVKYIHGEKREV